LALNKKNRLTRKKDFEEVFKKGKAVYGVFLLIRFLKKENEEEPKFAFPVSLKISKKAAERNKIRRILSETARLNLSKISKGFESVIISKPNIINQNAEIIRADLLNALKKARIL